MAHLDAKPKNDGHVRKGDVLSPNTGRELARRLIDASEQDRRAIERALHDGVQQLLAAIAVDLQRASRLMNDDPTAGKALLDELRALTRQALEQASELAELIYPPLLGEGQLVASMRFAAARAGIAASMQMAEEGRYPATTAGILYRCWVESLAALEGLPDRQLSIRDQGGAVVLELTASAAITPERLERLGDIVAALGGSSSPSDAQGLSGVIVSIPIS